MALDQHEEIRRLYFKTRRATIDRDFDRAIDLIKAMPEGERHRATVFMEGLAEMRKEFKKANASAKPQRRNGGV
jgi:hypothetical protein